MQGSNEDQERNGSGNGHDKDNIIRMPSPQERRQADKLKEGSVRTDREPLINLPPVTKILLALLIGVQILVSVVLTPVQKYWVLMHFGFVPAWYAGEPLSWSALISPFTYALLHGSWLHLGMNAVMLAAFGAGLERWMGGRRMIIFMVLCSLASVLAHLILNWGSEQVVIGASGAISGMFVAALMMLYQRSGTMPAGRFGFLPLIAVWIGISILFGVIGGPEGESIAWAAHVGGFLAGFVFLKPVMRWPSH